MSAEGGGPDGCSGLSDQVIWAAYALQNGLAGDDDGRSSASSLGGRAGLCSPSSHTARGGSGGGSNYGPSSYAVQRSHSRPVPMPAAAGGRIQPSADSPTFLPVGSLSPPSSPSQPSRLGPGGSPQNSHHHITYAAPAVSSAVVGEVESVGGQWEDLYGCSPPRPALPLQYQQYPQYHHHHYQQYQVPRGAGSPQLQSRHHSQHLEHQQHLLEPASQHGVPQVSVAPSPAAALAVLPPSMPAGSNFVGAPGAAALAIPPAGMPAGSSATAGSGMGEGRQNGESASTLNQLEHVASFGFDSVPPSLPLPTISRVERLSTSGQPLLPREGSSAAAGLAAAGAAAAEAVRQQLAAGERARRQAANQQADEDAKGEEEEEEEESVRAVAASAATPEAAVSFSIFEEDAGGQAGAERDEGNGKANGVSPEPSGSHAGITDGDELGLAEIQAGRRMRFYHRWSFWGRLLSLAVSFAFFLSGIVTLVVWPNVKLVWFNLWRWCFFLGCWPLIYWASVWAMWALTKFCEWRLFAARTAVYFLVGTRGALMLVMRSCLVLAAFAALFQTQPNLDADPAVQKVFNVLLKLLGCLVLMTAANLLKKVLIKLMSTHFHKEAHFHRMQEALRKEYFLSVMSQPREHRDSMQSYAHGPGGAAAQHNKSFAKRWLSRQALSKSVAAMHSLPTMMRSFTRRRVQRSQSDPLLVDGRQLSDGQTVAHVSDSGAACPQLQPAGSGSPFDILEQSNWSATAALTSVNVIVGAGVAPSSRSMPNLVPVGEAEQALGALQRQLADSIGPLYTPKTSSCGAASAGADKATVMGQRRSEIPSCLGAAAAPGSAAVGSPQRQPSRLSRTAGASSAAETGLTTAGDFLPHTPTGAPAMGSSPGRVGLLIHQTSRKLSHSLFPTGGSPIKFAEPATAAAAAAAMPAIAAARIEPRPSLASRATSRLSTLQAARQSFAFRAPSKQLSLVSLRSGAGGTASKALPPFQQLLDLGQTREELRARNRRTSIVQMPPEELEKMHHIEKHIRKNQLKLTLVDQLGSFKEKSGGSSNEQEARRVAFFLYHNLRASRKRNWIQQSDLQDFLPPQQAAEAFVYLDIDGNGRISQADLRQSVLKIFQERAHMALTLRDTKSVIGKLERLLGCIIHTLCVFFYLAIFNIDVTQAWLTFSSIMLAFTFIFGNSIRTVFECVVWLFVVHPYDVGDTLVLAGENHKVEEITLLNTVLNRWDGSRVYWPNSRLNTEQLYNLSRSANKSETLKLSLDMSTPLEALEMLRGTVETHVKGNPGEFTGASSVHVRALGDPMKLAIGIWYEFSHNGVDVGRCGRARTALYMVVAAALNAANVQFTLPPFPGDAKAVRAQTALEANPEMSQSMGVPVMRTMAL